MGTKPLQSDREMVVTLAATCIILALWLTSCGGGGGSTSPIQVTGPEFSSNPTSLPLPSVAVGSSSSDTATVTNIGGQTLTVSGVTFTGANPGDFSEKDTCASVAAGASCIATITFTPDAAGVRTATAMFSDNATGSPQPLPLSGTGLAPLVSLSAQSVPFGSQLVGTPVTEPVTLTNSGTASLTINSISQPTGTDSTYFSQTNNCPGSLAMNASCTISVTFNPTAPGTFNPTPPPGITITDNNNGVANSTQTISLSGTGNGPLGSVPATTPIPSTGASTQVGTTTQNTVTITNNGNTNLTISSVTATVQSGTNPFSVASTTCLSATVAPQGTCTVVVNFTPVSDTSYTGTLAGILTVVDNNLNVANTSQTGSLTATGSGTNPVASVSPTSLSFGSQSTATPSAALTVTLSNNGNAPLNLSNFQITPTPPFSASTGTTCPSSGPVAQGTSCVVTVVFAPGTTGSFSGTLTFTDNSSTSPQMVALSGLGTTSVVSILPLNIPFPNTNVNSTSPAPQPITVTNSSGSQSVTLGTISNSDITGTNGSASDFAISSTGTGACTSNETLAFGQSCFVYPTFTPVAEGNGLTATFTMSASLNSNGQLVAQSVNPVTLTGTGLGAVISPNQTSLSFGPVAIGTPTPPQQTVIITNNGNAPLNFLTTPAPPGVTGTNVGEFNLTTGTTCSTATPVAANGGTCTFGVTFAPTSTATVTNTNLTIYSTSTVNSPLQIPLSGSGTGPTATLSTSSLNFSSVQLGSSSSPQSLTLTNNGNSNLSFSGIPITGTNSSDYSASTTCGSTVAPNGGNCTITVTFTPATPPNPGTSLTASLTPSDNAPSNTTVTLTGTGTGPLASLTTSASMTFSNQPEGVASAAQTATLTNSGNAALTISSVGFTNNTPTAFAQTNTCPVSPSTLAAGASCTISVTFTPPTPTSFTGTLLTVIDNSGNQSGTQQTLSVSGNGTGPGAVPSPTSVTFSSQNQGTTSAAQAVTLTNNGSSALTISSIASGGTNPSNFPFVSGAGPVCPYAGGTLAVNSTCTIYVTFNPTAVANYSATINISDNAAGSPQTVSLTGSGVQGIQFNPTSLSFSSAIGTTSAAQTLTVSNPSTSSSNLTINNGGVTLTGSASSNFSPLVSNTCNNATLTPGGSSCAVTVQFTPSGPGSVSAAVSIADNLSTSPQSVTLSGSGTGPFASLATPTNFGPQNINTPSGSLVVSTLTNNGSVGTDTLTINSITSSDSEFVLVAGTGQCTYSGQTLAAGASCKIYATFEPTTEGGHFTTISVADNASGTPQTVTVTGTGDAPTATLSTGNPGTLTFSSQTLGTQSSPQTFTLTNTGNISLTLSGPALTGSGASNFQTSTCPTSLSTGTACTITVTFTPTTPGNLSATLTFTDNSNLVSGTTQTVNLIGTGSGAAPSPSPSPLNFGNQTQGFTSAPATITVTNLTNPPSNLSFTISSITIPTSTNSADFAISSSGNTCTSSVTPGNSCSFNVTFDPSTTSTETASVLITYTAYPNTQSVTLTGTGTALPVSLTPITFPTEAVTSPATPGTAMASVLSYTGTAGTLSISNISISTGANPGDFSLTTGSNACPSSGTLSGTTCNIWVLFAPTAAGTRTATLSVTDSATGSPHTTTLTGQGSLGQLTITSSLVLGSFNVGTSSAGACGSSNCVTVQNNSSTTAVTISNIAVTASGSSAGQFTINNSLTTCPTSGTLAASSSCVVNITFAPTTASVNPSTFSASLNFTDTASGSPQSAGLSGTGLAPEASFSAVAFGSQAGGTASGPELITLTNSGNANLTISSSPAPFFSTPGSNATDFTYTGTTTCAGTLAFTSPNNTCTYTITFTPAAAGSRSATFYVTDNSNNASPNTTTAGSVSGTGLHDVILTWSPSATYGVLTYDISRGTTSGGETALTSVTASTACTATTCTFVDQTVSPTSGVATSYFYVVTAVAADGVTQSPQSGEVGCTYPASGAAPTCQVTP